MRIFCSNPKAQYLSYKKEIDEAVIDVLDSGRYVLGNNVKLFEKEFSNYLDINHVIGVGSGTEALHIALHACGIKKNDEVITVSHTANATVSAIELTGAKTVFCDIEKDFYSIDVQKITSLITPNTKAIIAVHIYGQPTDLDKISSIAKENNLFLIEDCAQAHGATYNNQKVGTFGDISCFSFYPTKNLGAIGDGGALATNDPVMADKCNHIREYGWVERYHSFYKGWNSRLDELQAAILRIKLKSLDIDTNKRIDIANFYSNNIKNPLIDLPKVKKNIKHVYHLFVIRTKFRDDLKLFLEKNNIFPLIHYPIPIHKQKAYVNSSNNKSIKLTNTEFVSNQILSLPMYPELNELELKYIVKTLNEFKI